MGSPVDLGGEEAAQQVVARGSRALLHLLPEELADAVVPAPPALGIVGELERVADPSREGVRHLLGHAQDGAITRTGICWA